MSFFNELKRRNVIKTAITYAILSWLALQVADVILGNIDAPEWVFNVLLLFLVIGFFFTVIFSWAFELTPEGLKREREVDPDSSITSETGRKIDRVIIGLLAICVVYLAADNYFLSDREETEPVAAELSEKQVDDDGYDSIAVLPFANMSGDAEQEYFSDGIAEELLNALAKQKNLQVAARTSSFAFKGMNQDITEIGNALKVETVLEGSVRRSGNRLRITAQLIDIENGYHLWSEVYDRELTDVFAVQDEITAAIVAALRIHLDGGSDAPAETAANTSMIAYDAYLKGMHALQEFGADSMREALSSFRAATEADPQFAPAWAGRAVAVIALRETDFWGSIPTEDAFVLARSNIDRALELDPNLAWAHLAEAFLHSDKYRYEEALESLDRAVELNPNFAEAWSMKARIFGRFGRVGESREAMLVALQLDPGNAATGILAANLATDFYDPEFSEIVKEATADIPRTRQIFYIFDLSMSGQISKEGYAEAMETVAAQQPYTAMLNLQLLKEIDEESLANASRNPGDFLMWTFMQTDQWDKALAMYEELPEERQQSALNLEELSIMQASMGLCEEAIDSIDVAHDGEIRVHGLLGPIAGRSNSNLALNRVYCLQQLGLSSEAEPVLERVRHYVETLRDNTEYGKYLIDAKLRVLDGDIEGALIVLEDAYERDELSWMDRYDPLLRQLNEEPRFIALFERIGASIDELRNSLGMPPADI